MNHALRSLLFLACCGPLLAQDAKPSFQVGLQLLQPLGQLAEDARPLPTAGLVALVERPISGRSSLRLRTGIAFFNLRNAPKVWNGTTERHHPGYRSDLTQVGLQLEATVSLGSASYVVAGLGLDWMSRSHEGKAPTYLVPDGDGNLYLAENRPSSHHRSLSSALGWGWRFSRSHAVEVRLEQSRYLLYGLKATGETREMERTGTRISIGHLWRK